VLVLFFVVFISTKSSITTVTNDVMLGLFPGAKRLFTILNAPVLVVSYTIASTAAAAAVTVSSLRSSGVNAARLKEIMQITAFVADMIGLL